MQFIVEFSVDSFEFNVVFFSLTATTNLKPVCVEITHEEDAPGELTAHLHTLRRS